MSAFLSKFVLERGVGVDSWILAEPLIYGDGEAELHIPKGFKTDFASIPRIFHRLLPKNGLYDPAAVLHDYLYAANGDVALVYHDDGEISSKRKFSREQCDRIFLEAMESVGVGWLKRKTIFRAVRCGGMFAWNSHARRLLATGKNIAVKFSTLILCSFFFSGCMSTRLVKALENSNATVSVRINTVYGRAEISRANPQPGQTAIIHPDGRIEVKACEP
jgi:hypothetical protein